MSSSSSEEIEIIQKRVIPRIYALNDKQMCKTRSKRSTQQEETDRYNLVRSVFLRHTTSTDRKYIGALRARFDEKTKCMILPRLYDIVFPLLGVRTASGGDDVRGWQEFSSATERRRLAKSMGKLSALVHFGAKLDGNDTEFVWARSHGSKNRKLYVIDYDWSAPYSVATAEQLASMFWTSMFQCPSPKQTPQLFEIFKDAYITTAAQFRAKTRAQQVINFVIENDQN